MTAGDSTKHPIRRLLSNRRGLLAGAAAVVGAALARLDNAERADAAHTGSDETIIHANVPNTTTGVTSVVSEATLSPAFVGVSGPIGVFSSSSPDGVQGITNSIAPQAAGVRGIVDTGPGAGVRGEGRGGAIGVWADATTRVGVFGTSTGASGIFGVSKPADPNLTSAPSTLAGVAGQGFGRVGVFGLSDNNVGVRGESTSSIGVLGSSASVYGVNGVSTSGAGVFGVSNTGFGVYGYSYGSGGSAVGLYGVANSGEGLVGLTQTGIGVHGNAVAGGLAGRFDGRVLVNGNLTVTGGLTTSAIAAADGNYRRMYSQESPEPWVEDFGTAMLQNGRAEIALDPELDAVVESNEYLVFPVPEGNCNGLFISQKGPHGFVVEELNGGRSTLPFSYRVVARRRDVPSKRLERVPAANINLGKDAPPPPAPRGIPDARPVPASPAPRPDMQQRP